MIVILARHGDAEGTKGKFHGLNDSNLTSAGVDEAKELAVELTGRGIQQIYASPLKRTADTARIIGNKLNLPVKLVKALEPLDLGDLVGKPTNDHYTELVRSYLDNPSRKIPGAGSNNTIDKWANNFIPFINSLIYDGSKKIALVVTHGRNIILTKAETKFGNNSKYDKKDLVNADKSVEHGGYAIVSPGKFEIITPKKVPVGQS